MVLVHIIENNLSTEKADGHLIWDCSAETHESPGLVWKNSIHCISRCTIVETLHKLAAREGPALSCFAQASMV
jgi:hypothetical protein